MSCFNIGNIDVGMDGEFFIIAGPCVIESEDVCLEVAGQLNRKVDIPLVFMTYFNPVFSYGLEEFSNACSQSARRDTYIFNSPGELRSRNLATESTERMIYGVVRDVRAVARAITNNARLKCLSIVDSLIVFILHIQLAE